MLNLFKNAKLRRLETLALNRGRTGGVIKRIDENRELLELLDKEAPEFMQKHPWVAGWIEGNDNFFEEVRATLNVVSPLPVSTFPRPWPRKI